MGATRASDSSPVPARRLLQRFGPYAVKQWRLIAVGLAALGAEVILRLAEPWPLKVVIDYVIAPAPGTEAPVLPLVGPLGTMTLLVGAAAVTILAVAGRAGVSFAHTVAFAKAGNLVCRELRDALFRHVQRLPIAFHRRARSGDLLLRVIGDAGMLRDVVLTAAMPLAANVLVFAAMVGVMCWLRWDLALLALAPAPLFFVSSSRVAGRISQVARAHRQTESALAASASEAIAAAATVQTLSLEDHFSEAFHQQGAKGLQSGVQATRLSARLERSTDVFVGVSTALVMLYGAYLVLRAQLTAGDLIVFLAYLKAAVKPVKDVAKYLGRMAKARASAERIVNVLDLVPAIRDAPDARPLVTVRGHLRFERVSFGYDDDHPVLHEVDFEIFPGETVALVGGSGHGKSTIAGLVLRLHDPVQGRVLVDKCDIREFTLESLRRQIAAVSQDSQLFAVSIRENIRLGTPGATDSAVIQAAETAAARAFIEALPRGFDTLVGERGLTLSEGQRQRLLFARAAIRPARLVVLDEPTAGLDEENQRVVGEAIARLAGSRTVLLITHDLALAARADRVLYLDNGRVLEEGSHSQLLRAAGRYARLYRLQVEDRSTAASHAV